MPRLRKPELTTSDYGVGYVSLFLPVIFYRYHGSVTRRVRFVGWKFVFVSVTFRGIR